MPELPEVQTVVTTLRPKMVGRTIRRARLLRRDIVEPPQADFVAAVENRQVADIGRRGKKIVFTLSDGNRFVIHLGMSGRLTFSTADSPAPKHTHLVLEVSGGGEVRFFDPRRFGGVFWLGEHGQADADLGPEPLDMRDDDLFARLHKSRRAVKTALLDQKLIAGIGNIYADEALFAARIHPATPANRLSPDEARRLMAAIQSTLTRALRHKGSTLRDYRDADGNRGGFQNLHRVYNREGRPCPRCGAPIGRQVIGGRSAHFCPVCQRKRAARKSRGA